ncbi:MAG: NAD(P)/FAD-dependent oxidoreductase, partial [Alphaproteobacteria bacterium]|nr:NAD(P)/FAD-dependent oxidoreductase [Alphaproteobacteria bacterium]
GEPLLIDLRPDLSPETIAAKLAKRKPKDSQSNALRKAFNLTPAAIGLMREVGATDPKRVSLMLTGPAGLARAISSAGGIARHEVDEHFQLRKVPGYYAVGEMLDWEAPTGGYLLQACFSTAVVAARHLLLTHT